MGSEDEIEFYGKRATAQELCLSVCSGKIIHQFHASLEESTACRREENSEDENRRKKGCSRGGEGKLNETRLTNRPTNCI